MCNECKQYMPKMFNSKIKKCLFIPKLIVSRTTTCQSGP